MCTLRACGEGGNILGVFLYTTLLHLTHALLCPPRLVRCEGAAWRLGKSRPMAATFRTVRVPPFKRERADGRIYSTDEIAGAERSPEGGVLSGVIALRGTAVSYCWSPYHCMDSKEAALVGGHPCQPHYAPSFFSMRHATVRGNPTSWSAFGGASAALLL